MLLSFYRYLWCLSIIVAIVKCLNEGELNVINKLPICCPIGWFLFKTSNASHPNDRYDCLSSSFVSLMSKMSSPSLQIKPNTNGSKNMLEVTYAVYGYGIEVYNSSIPDCDQQRLTPLDNHSRNIQIPLKSCFVKMKAYYAIISCSPLVFNTTDDDKSLTLSFIHKCCPNMYIYNGKQRKCIKVNNELYLNNTLPYEFYYGNYGVFIDNTVMCPRHRVLVEYEINQLQKNFRQQYHNEDYCIESIHDVQDDDVQMNGKSTNYLVRACVNKDICQQLTCIRRCCNDGEMIARGNGTSFCRKDLSDISYHSFNSLEFSGNFTLPQVFGIIHGLDCLKYRLNPEAYADEFHMINQRDGSLFIPSTGKIYSNDQYCLEKINNTKSYDEKLMHTFLCFDSRTIDAERIRFKLYPIGLLISCLFYAITLLIYSLISQLRNLPGKILICLVFNLFMAYLMIALGQLIPTSSQGLCFAFGFTTYFCLMAAFTWMNVMCFDIWQTFGSTRSKYSGFQKQQTKRFIMYSIYGWGLPTLITMVTAIIISSNVLSANLRPNFGNGRCWFTYDTPSTANIIFFSGPLGVLFLINFILFVLTLRYVNRVKREICRMQSSNVNKSLLKRRFFIDKTRFAMNTKLFIVMGITWFLELLSILFYTRKMIFLWAISDSFNVLLGVFVCIIFVFKKRIWCIILQKCHIRTPHKIMTNNRTIMSSFQATTANSSMRNLNKIDKNCDNYLKPLSSNVERSLTM